MANVFHVFCALFLLSQEELHSLDTKIDEIHTLFDFDKSGGLNRVELECLFQACVEGLASQEGCPIGRQRCSRLLWRASRLHRHVVHL